jgi:DNA modification methylase
MLYKGDCLEIMKLIPEKSIDMILTDLPYGTTACRWDVVIPFDELWKQFERIIKDGCAIALFGSEPFASHMRLSNLKKYKYDWVWKKNAGSNFASTRFQPMKEHETISIFGSKSVRYYPIFEPRMASGLARVKSSPMMLNTTPSECYGLVKFDPQVRVQRKDLRVPSSVQKFNRERGLHPTQKPVALLEYLIKTYTNQGETVLDSCMGSGSTGVACKNTKRKFIGIEKDDKYFEIAKARINAAPIRSAQLDLASL